MSIIDWSADVCSSDLPEAPTGEKYRRRRDKPDRRRRQGGWPQSAGRAGGAGRVPGERPALDQRAFQGLRADRRNVVPEQSERALGEIGREQCRARMCMDGKSWVDAFKLKIKTN